MNTVHFATLLILTFGTKSFAAEVAFDSEVEIKTVNETDFKIQPAGSTINLDDQVYLVSNKDAVPVILLPLNTKNKVTLLSSDLNNLFQKQASVFISKKVDHIIKELRSTESLISKRDYTQALVNVKNLKTNNPGVASIYFLSGTVNYLTKNNSDAIEDLKLGLAIEPDNIKAQNLLKLLGGTK